MPPPVQFVKNAGTDALRPAISDCTKPRKEFGAISGIDWTEDGTITCEAGANVELKLID